jgi:hypothetical protein
MKPIAAGEGMAMRIVMTACVLFLMTVSAHAQFGIGYITYDIAHPTGDTEDYLSKTSLRGIGLGVGKFLLSERLCVGISWHWSTFQETSRATIALDEGVAVSGDQVRRIYSSPILAQVAYHAPPLRRYWNIEPFVEFGVGAYYIHKRLDVGITQYEEKHWHAGFVPGAGLCIPAYAKIDCRLDIGYNYIFKAGGDTAHSYLEVGLGLAYKL